MKKHVETMAKLAQKPKRIKKECIGCGDYFTCYKQANYDYCRECAINGNRYCQNQCPECGDGSGIIKFKNQRPRLCKTCLLTKPLTKSKIPCFYGCSFLATVEQIMEEHYKKKHRLNAKEVKRA